MEQFTQFVSNVAQSGMGNEMVQMFGVMPSNPDAWLQEKGQEVGREVMGKLMNAVYQAEGMEPPADAIVTRSFSPADLISNSGLGDGKLGHILAPIMAGVVTSITQSGVLNHIASFATKRVGKTIEEHSDSIAKHGESLGSMLIDGICKIAHTKQSGGAQQAPNGHGGQRDFQDPHATDPNIGEAADIDLDNINFDIIDENALFGDTYNDGDNHVRSRGGGVGAGVQDRSPGGAADGIIQAVMKPVARGVNGALKKPGLLQKLVDSVSGLVPVEKIKESLKTTLYPQYQKVCRTFSPHMETFGGVAGQKIIEFLQTLAQITDQGEVEKQRDMCIKNTMSANENVERSLMSPIMQPFLSGVLLKLAQSGWKNEIAMGMAKKLFGSLTSCFGSGTGKMPQLSDSAPQGGSGGYQQQQQQQQNAGGAQGGVQQGAFMQGQRF